MSLTQSYLMTSLSHSTADWFSPVSVANELSARHSNIWLVFFVAVSQHASETLHLPQLHLYRSVTRWFMYAIGGYFMYVEFAAAVFITCSQQHVVDVLAVASLSTSSATAAAAAWQIYSAKTKYVNIVMYLITMPIPLPLRVVMTELSIHPFIHSSIHPFVHSSIRPSIHPSVRPSVHPSVRLSVRPSLCLSVCLSIL